MYTPLKFRENSDLIGFAVLMIDWMLIVGIVAFSLQLTTYNLQFITRQIIYCISVLLIGMIQFSIGESLLHEASHNHLFKTKKLNKYLSVFYTLPFFNTYERYKRDHMEHHKNLGKDGEPTLVIYHKLGLFNNKNLYWNVVVKPTIGYAAYFFIKRAILSLIKEPVTLYFWIGVIMVSYFFNATNILFWYWLIPLIFVFSCMIIRSEITDHYATKSGVRSNLNYIHNLIHHNNGYHALHHKHPEIPWFNLPSTYKDLKEKNIEIPTDVTHSLFETYRQICQNKNDIH